MVQPAALGQRRCHKAIVRRIFHRREGCRLPHRFPEHIAEAIAGIVVLHVVRRALVEEGVQHRLGPESEMQAQRVGGVPIAQALQLRGIDEPGRQLGDVGAASASAAPAWWPDSRARNSRRHRIARSPARCPLAQPVALGADQHRRARQMVIADARIRNVPRNRRKAPGCRPGSAIRNPARFARARSRPARRSKRGAVEGGGDDRDGRGHRSPSLTRLSRSRQWSGFWR